MIHSVSTQSSVRRARRPLHGQVIAGVAIGLAQHLRLPVWVVRGAFVVLAFATGIGVVLYAAFWAVLPLDVDSDAENTTQVRAADTTRLLALAAIAVAVALLLTASGVRILDGIFAPILVAVFGAALVWRQTDDEQRDEWSALAGKAARHTAGTAASAGSWRIVLGTGLVFVAIVSLIVGHTSVGLAVQALAIALLIVFGVGLVVFPWAYRRWRAQNEERRALIRSEERAEVAAHVHDSVLQTLTLIQRFADDPQEVIRLARTEERALRSWLYAPVGDPTRTFAAALEAVAQEVETSYNATIDVVSVGDAPLDVGLSPLVAAAREAMLNASQHGGGQVSVYSEVDNVRAEVFVRDRGCGFDVSRIPEGRHGVRDSLIGRMERNGGTAVITSSPDSGTNVHLVLPLHKVSSP